MYRPFARAIPSLFGALWLPLLKLSSCAEIRGDPIARTTPMVSSVQPSPTTMISKSRTLCSSAENNVGLMCALRL